MRALETIHLRLGSGSRTDLSELIKQSLGGSIEQIDARIYLHASLDTDLAVHIYWDHFSPDSLHSSLGMRLASTLRGYGMVEHSLWILTDANCTGGEAVDPSLLEPPEKVD